MRARIACRIAVGAMLVLALQTAGAEAHHAMGGMAPTTFLQGFLSGVGHPILGADHFAFVVGIGFLAAIGGFGLALPAMFIVAMVAGLGVHLARFDVPYSEVMLAVSVVAIGLAVARGPEHRMPWIGAALFAIAGVLHGYAFAESVVGSEPTPILAYVLGLAAMQMTIAALAWQVARVVPGGSPLMSPIAVRAMGGAIAIVGAVVLALNVGAMA